MLTIRGRDQVMLKVTVAEVSRDIAKQLGHHHKLAHRQLGQLHPI